MSECKHTAGSWLDGYGRVTCGKCGLLVYGKDCANEDKVNHPKHYNSHPSGVECITVTEHMSFNIGNAIKYLWRSDHKGAKIQDLRKAAFYIAREIGRVDGVPSSE